ncbi:hypothetical protein [Mesorhizobium sp.]|uniref:hypothetical protein n=1 Tax=Mesorhizobium sp. TaxID=1871066 RepID=UPI000FE760DC|nr:hypothetical protein [Mesorhizobium sp.]RWB66813.1 MAG: hypothetical protein EOQ49_27465 [Mesorhizobium sp.]RWB84122.1 MAG: hypothetical protein EOQ52_24530 [Mesorhizobium sp.]
MKRFFSSLGNVLVRDTIPVWLSLILMVLGAAATYWLAPKINAEFELQSARREFLVKNLENFSSDTRGLIDVISKGVNETDREKYQAIISDVNPSVAKLQFAATQLLYVVPEQSEEIVAFQMTLDKLQDSFLSFRIGGNATGILNDSKSLMKQSLQIYESLLAKAGLGDHIRPVPLSR